MEQRSLTPTAVVYDFDGTLAPGNMQEHSFIREHGLSADAFWAEVKARAKAEDADEILVYMRTMLDHARRRNTPITGLEASRTGKLSRKMPGAMLNMAASTAAASTCVIRGALRTDVALS